MANALGITITAENLSDLLSVGPNQYKVVIKLFNSSWQPLNSPYVQNSNEVIVTTTNVTFIAKIPIADADYAINNFRIKAFANNDTDCCFAQSNLLNFTNEDSEPTVNELEVGGYFSAN